MVIHCTLYIHVHVHVGVVLAVLPHYMYSTVITCIYCIIHVPECKGSRNFAKLRPILSVITPVNAHISPKNASRELVRS